MRSGARTQLGVGRAGKVARTSCCNFGDEYSGFVMVVQESSGKRDDYNDKDCDNDDDDDVAVVKVRVLHGYWRKG